MKEALRKLNLDKRIESQVQAWLQPPYDETTRKDVERMVASGDFNEIIDRFYKDLEFGTGGLRGIVGTGTNRMNRYTVQRATQGLSNYLLKIYGEGPIKVAVSYDSRHYSKEFSRLVAEVFAANGIEVFLCEDIRPTPLLSFAIRHLNCQAGVMITASHNPKEYNGYKAYWADGGQLVTPHDQGVIQEVQAIRSPLEVKTTPSFSGEIHSIGAELDKEYLEAIYRLSIRPDVVRQHQDLRIVFSSLHGTGITLVPHALERWGFRNVAIVDRQAKPDGDFPTVVYPNPEEEDAMRLAIEEAERTDADLVMATDPDADRVGVAVRGPQGYQLLNGNQIGSLLVDYVLAGLAEKNKLEPGDYVAKTIVTTSLISDIAAQYEVPCLDVLTGFKYIGALITERENTGRFLVGGEESFGYLVGQLVRDKDAIISCAIIAEMAAFYQSKRKSLNQALIELYLRHGYYKEKLISLTKKGKKGADAIKGIMSRLREEKPQQLGGVSIHKVSDYQVGKTYDLISGTVQTIELPTSNVLQFQSAEGDVLTIRPSGTEPKIKFYCSVRGELDEVAKLDAIEKSLDKKIEQMMKDILAFDTDQNVER